MRLSPLEIERNQRVESEALEFAQAQLAKGAQVCVASIYIKDRVRVREYLESIGYKGSMILAGRGPAEIEKSQLSFVGTRELASGFRSTKAISLVVLRPESYRVAIQIAGAVNHDSECYIPYAVGPNLFHIRRGLDRKDKELMNSVHYGKYIGDYP